MSYLQNTATNGIYNPYFRLENLESGLKKSLYRNSLVEGRTFDDKTFEVLENYKQELNKIRKDNLGINFYASFLAIAVFHTYTIYKHKKLLSEMGIGAMSHLNKCGWIGLVAGTAVGYLLGKDMKTYLKYLNAKSYHQKALDKFLLQKK
jgi:hypothetical protein